MNYYNPYFYAVPNVTSAAKTGLFSRIFGNLSFGKIVNGTQRALSFANQAIPFVKQVKPMIGNAKTMFKVMNEFKKTENHRQNYNKLINSYNNYSSNNNNVIKTKQIENSNAGPTFFM